MPKFFVFVCFFAVLCGFSPVSNASDWVENEHFRSRLAAIPDAGNTLAVLEVKMEEGWHTYGPEPGDAGLPPRFNWENSENLNKVEITYPEPLHKREFDMFDVNAYEDLTQFSLQIFPDTPDEDVVLNLKLNLMVCKDICIPEEVDLSLPLTAVTHKP